MSNTPKEVIKEDFVNETVKEDFMKETVKEDFIKGIAGMDPAEAIGEDFITEHPEDEPLSPGEILGDDLVNFKMSDGASFDGKIYLTHWDDLDDEGIKLGAAFVLHDEDGSRNHQESEIRPDYIFSIEETEKDIFSVSVFVRREEEKEILGIEGLSNAFETLRNLSGFSIAETPMQSSIDSKNENKDEITFAPAYYDSSTETFRTTKENLCLGSLDPETGEFDFSKMDKSIEKPPLSFRGKNELQEHCEWEKRTDRVDPTGTANYLGEIMKEYMNLKGDPEMFPPVKMTVGEFQKNKLPERLQRVELIDSQETKYPEIEAIVNDILTNPGKDLYRLAELGALFNSEDGITKELGSIFDRDGNQEEIKTLIDSGVLYSGLGTTFLYCDASMGEREELTVSEYRPHGYPVSRIGDGQWHETTYAAKQVAGDFLYLEGVSNVTKAKAINNPVILDKGQYLTISPSSDIKFVHPSDIKEYRFNVELGALLDAAIEGSLVLPEKEHNLSSEQEYETPPDPASCVGVESMASKTQIYFKGKTGGKTTTAEYCIEHLQASSPDKSAGMPVSFTTRGIREGEVEGRDYYFLDKSEAKNLIENNGVVEFSRVDHKSSDGTLSGDYDLYGTLVSEVEKYDVLLFVTDEHGVEASLPFVDAVIDFSVPEDEMRTILSAKGLSFGEISKRFSREVNTDTLHIPADYTVDTLNKNTGRLALQAIKDALKGDTLMRAEEWMAKAFSPYLSKDVALFVAEEFLSHGNAKDCFEFAKSLQAYGILDDDMRKSFESRIIRRSHKDGIEGLVSFSQEISGSDESRIFSQIDKILSVDPSSTKSLEVLWDASLSDTAAKIVDKHLSPLSGNTSSDNGIDALFADDGSKENLSFSKTLPNP